MRGRTLASLSILLLAFPLVAADPPAPAAPDAVGVLHLEGPPIEVFSWSWGATQTPDRSAGGAGKVQFQDLHFTKKVDKSSASLFRACATGKHFPDATLVLRKAGKGQQEYMIVKFTDLLVSSYQTGGSSGDTTPMESISLNYANVEIEGP